MNNEYTQGIKLLCRMMISLKKKHNKTRHKSYIFILFILVVYYRQKKCLLFKRIHFKNRKQCIVHLLFSVSELKVKSNTFAIPFKS